MPPQLVALTEGPDLLLDKPILLLGRHQECDIQLNSRKISRRHCCIAQVNNQLVVRDLCSTNGIRINGSRVVEGHLKAGDQLTIGNYHYRVQWDEQQAQPSPVPAARAEPPRRGLLEEDPMLSCDVPVPLKEPGGRPHLAGPHVPPHKIGGDEPAPPPEPPPPRILPENLSLAPLSDFIPKHDSKPPSHSPS